MWFKVDDQLHDHRKVRRLGKDRAAAMGVWVLCGSWAADNLTDGFVPTEVTERYDPSGKLAKRLVDVGFWHPSEQDGEPGYTFHDWTDHQPTRAEVLADREKRAAAGRLGGRASARARATANGQANGQAHASTGATPNGRPNGQASAQAKTNDVATPSRPDPSRPSLSSLSSRQLLSEQCGLTEREMTKTLDLLHASLTVGNEDALIRKLIGNGDIDRWITKARAALDDDTPRHRLPVHDFQPDNGGLTCTYKSCGMWQPHANHKTGDRAGANA